jgi:hypothetical protein
MRARRSLRTGHGVARPSRSYKANPSSTWARDDYAKSARHS